MMNPIEETIGEIKKEENNSSKWRDDSYVRKEWIFVACKVDKGYA